MRYLKQSTSVDVPIGPFLDSTDGVTAETALTITQPDVRLKKNGGNWAQKNAAQTLSHEENGWYEVTLDAADTDTLGALVLAVNESGALPVWHEFSVLPSNVYDSLFSTDLLQVDVTQWGGTAVGSTEVRANLINVAGAAVNTSSAQLGVNVVNAAGTAWNSGAISASTLAADAITDAKVASDVTIASVTGAVGSVTGNVGGNVAGSVGSVTATVNANVTQISGDTAAADNAESFFDGTGYGPVLQRTTITNLSSQTVFDLSAGSADDDAYNYCLLVIEDQSTAAQKAVVVVEDYTGSTKTVTLHAAPAFTVANGDVVTVLSDRSLKPITNNRYLRLTATGGASIDWANVENPTTTIGLSGTTVKTATDVEADTADIQSRLPAALVSGRIDASVGAMAANTLTASALASDAVSEIQSGLSTVTTAQVNAEVDTALADIHLDHLIAAADPGGVVANSSFLAKLVSKSGTPAFTSYDNTTDSLEAQRDAQDALDDYVDTEVAAIKAKTDQLTFTVANQVDSRPTTMANGVITANAIQTGAITDQKFASDAITSDVISDTGAQKVRRILTGTATGGSNVTLQDTNNLTQSATDYWKGCLVHFTTGSLAGQVRLVTAFDPATDTISFTPATTTAVSVESYDILPWGRVDVGSWVGTIPTLLVGNRVPADVGSVSGDVTAADNLEAYFEGAFLTGSVSDGAPAAGDFDAASGLSSADDFYNGSALAFTSGTLKGVARKITDYTGSTRNLVFATAFPTAPANADTFIILGRIE